MADFVRNLLTPRAARTVPRSEGDAHEHASLPGERSSVTEGEVMIHCDAVARAKLFKVEDLSSFLLESLQPPPPRKHTTSTPRRGAGHTTPRKPAITPRTRAGAEKARCSPKTEKKSVEQWGVRVKRD